MGKDILLIDLTPTVRFALRHALQGSDYAIGHEAQTDAEGQHYFETLQPSVVIFDMTLSPHQKLQAIRQFHKRFSKSRVLALYSRMSRPNVAEARRAGAQEMLGFPFNKEGFLEALKRLAGPSSPPGPEPIPGPQPSE